MLDDYKNEQPIVYKVLTNAIFKNKYSHAYLFELNGYSNGYEVALAFAKFLLCPNNYTNNLRCDKCNQCCKIDSNNFLEIKIINPDGQWIKKEQLEELQKEFMTKSLVGNKKVYIINNADRLNVHASNSLLKFLEEPPEGIIAILITDNMYQLLNTIISRCQIISFKKNNLTSLDLKTEEKIGKYLYNNLDEYNSFISDYAHTYIDNVIEYILFFEVNMEETVVTKNKEFLELFNDRKKVQLAFELLVLYYKDVLNNLIGIDVNYYSDYIDSIKKVSSKNNISKISEKIKILVDLSNTINFNVNLNLLMDKLIILLSEV